MTKRSFSAFAPLAIAVTMVATAHGAAASLIGDTVEIVNFDQGVQDFSASLLVTDQREIDVCTTAFNNGVCESAIFVVDIGAADILVSLENVGTSAIFGRASELVFKGLNGPGNPIGYTEERAEFGPQVCTLIGDQFGCNRPGTYVLNPGQTFTTFVRLQFAVAEPASTTILASGLLALSIARRRKRSFE